MSTHILAYNTQFSQFGTQCDLNKHSFTNKCFTCILYSLMFMISFEFHTQNGNLQVTVYKKRPHLSGICLMCGPIVALCKEISRYITSFYIPHYLVFSKAGITSSILDMQCLQVLIKFISDKFDINFTLLKKVHLIEIQLDFYYLKRESIPICKI